METLDSYKNSRENNFNLLRFIAASMVLVSHSFPLATGSGISEPLKRFIGITFGHIAVDVFFITSGFLITGSLLRSKSYFSYVAARALRIYPALFVAISLIVFVMGPLVTSLSIGEYFSKETFVYFAKNVTLFMGVSHTLPGVFENIPWHSAVNGSLWTLPYELKMYFYLFVVFVLLKESRAYLPDFIKRFYKFEYVIATLAITSVTLHIANHFYFHMFNDFIRLFSFFFVGSFFYCFAHRIVLNNLLFFVATGLLVVSLFSKDAFMLCYILLLPYLVFYLAYIPRGIIRKFNQLGDYSYGIYIYSFPIQQLTAFAIVGISVLQMTVLAGVITLCFAMASWHIVEKRSLSFKPKSS